MKKIAMVVVGIVSSLMFGMSSETAKAELRNENQEIAQTNTSDPRQQLVEDFGLTPGKITVEEVAELLYTLAFEKSGSFYWGLLGVDWSKPPVVEGEAGVIYQADLEWFKAAPKEKWTLENGVVAYYLANGTSQKTVILSHGYRGDSSLMGPWARLYYDLGYNILTPDASGHGDSAGETINFGWNEKTNYLKWIDQVIEKTGSESEIVLHGVSMGSATVLMTAGEDLPGNVVGIIGDSAYTSVWDQMTYISGLVAEQIGELLEISPEEVSQALPILDGLVTERLGFSMSAASVVDQVKQATKPIGLIHSRDDLFIPESSSETIFNAIGSQQKYFWRAAGGGHIGGVHNNREDYLETVKNYLEMARNGESKPYLISEIIIEFVDESGQKLADNQLYHGRVGESLAVELPMITDYALPDDVVTTYLFTETDQLITFTYTKKIPPLKMILLTVRLVDQEGAPVAEPLILSGVNGETYDVPLPEITGYQLPETTNRLSGVFNENEEEKRIVYQKIEDQMDQSSSETSTSVREEKKEQNLPKTGESPTIEFILIGVLLGIISSLGYILSAQRADRNSDN